MQTVENAAYKLHPEYSSLKGSDRLRFDLREPNDHFFADLPQLAQELGFIKKGSSPTKKALWDIYDRPMHPVPNFPDGQTIINSTLALYKTREGLLTRAVLRASTEPYKSDEFMKDLDAFTKHYVERPRILGFPSKFLTTGPAAMAGGFIVGISVFSGVDYYAWHSTGSIMNAGSVLGEIAGFVGGAGLWALSERYARKQISGLDQYFAQRNARDVLTSERYHRVTVDMQREIYEALQQNGADLEPDQFLEKIYGQLPSSLVETRHAEIDQAKC